MSLRGSTSKGIEQERGGASTGLTVGRAFFVLQTGSIFSQKRVNTAETGCVYADSGQDWPKRRRSRGMLFSSLLFSSLLFSLCYIPSCSLRELPGSCRLLSVAPLQRVSFFLIEPTEPIVFAARERGSEPKIQFPAPPLKHSPKCLATSWPA